MSDDSTPPPEAPIIKPDALDDYDTAGVVSILIRTVRSDDKIKELTSQIAEANAALSAERLARAKGVTALGVYGFDPTANKLWVAVREVLGDEKYDGAIAIARGKGPAPPKAGLEARTVETSTAQSEGADGKTIDANGAVSTPPKISDAILAFLKEAGPKGSQVGSVKEHLLETYGITTHDKTPGMTLYRLLKDGKVRRDKRTWFYVDLDVSGKAENPGGGPPGHESSVAEEETAEC